VAQKKFSSKRRPQLAITLEQSATIVLAQLALLLNSYSPIAQASCIQLFLDPSLNFHMIVMSRK